jgi:hypothetical protein
LPDSKIFTKFENLFILQETLSDDEPVPLVGEKRGRDDDRHDDRMTATRYSQLELELKLELEMKIKMKMKMEPE